MALFGLLKKKKTEIIKEVTSKSQITICEEMLLASVDVKKELTDNLKELSPDELKSLQLRIDGKIELYHSKGGEFFYFPNERNKCVLGHTKLLAIKAILDNYIIFKEELDGQWKDD